MKESNTIKGSKVMSIMKRKPVEKYLTTPNQQRNNNAVAQVREIRLTKTIITMETSGFIPL